MQVEMREGGGVASLAFNMGTILPITYWVEGWGEGNEARPVTFPSPGFAALATLSPEGERGFWDQKSSGASSSFTCQGRPCLFSMSMKGSGSNCSMLNTPSPFHAPVSMRAAPIIAGTPVV